MKTVIFSDTHLNNRFHQRTYDFLVKLISLADKVIINGDLWDGYIIKFDEFVNSEWKKLFPLLKEKQAVYLYGNHDQKELSDERVELFSNEHGLNYTLKVGEYVLNIEHGDRLAKHFEKYNDRLPKFITKLDYGKVLHQNLELVHRLGGKHIYKLAFFQNRRMKKYARENMKGNEILVCGDSHLAEFNLKKKFINTGFIEGGLAQYLLIENDKMKLETMKY